MKSPPKAPLKCVVRLGGVFELDANMSTTVSQEMYFLHVVLSYLKVYPVTHNQLLLNTLDKADSTI